jgi:hypothetical protein
MPANLKNPKKFDPLTRFLLRYGEEVSYGVPLFFIVVANAFAYFSLREQVSALSSGALSILLLGQLVILLIGINLAVHLRFRRAEHRRLIDYVETLRQYTVANVEKTKERLNGLASQAEPPPVEVPKPTPDDWEQRPLGTRERNTLLALIGVLCSEAKIDVRKPAAAAATIKRAAELMNVSIGESTIEEHLKRVRDGLDARSY